MRQTRSSTAVRFAAHRLTRFSFATLTTAAVLSSATASAQTTVTIPPVSVGAGLQTSVVSNMPEDGDSVTTFPLNSVRLYVSGGVMEKVKFMFNTEYTGNPGVVGILDAAVQYEFSPKANIWAGRFLPPSDRANLYGPYYSSNWATFQDGVQDGYPFAYVGRDNGIMWWGQFDKVKLSAGAFDGRTTTGDSKVLVAARAQVDFWDAENGYYLNGTYYGQKNLLALGFAVQSQGSDRTAYNVDFLMERKVTGGGAVTVESEYAVYDALGGYDGDYAESKGGYVLGAYLFPGVIGKGRMQLLGKFGNATFERGITILDVDYDQTTTELNLNYVMKEHNSRVMFFFKNTDFSAVRQSFKQVGVGFQIQM